MNPEARLSNTNPVSIDGVHRDQKQTYTIKAPTSRELSRSRAVAAACARALQADEVAYRFSISAASAPRSHPITIKSKKEKVRKADTLRQPKSRAGRKDDSKNRKKLQAGDLEVTPREKSANHLAVSAEGACQEESSQAMELEFSSSSESDSDEEACESEVENHVVNDVVKPNSAAAASSSSSTPAITHPRPSAPTVIIPFQRGEHNQQQQQQTITRERAKKRRKRDHRSSLLRKCFLIKLIHEEEERKQEEAMQLSVLRMQASVITCLGSVMAAVAESIALNSRLLEILLTKGKI